MKHNNFKILIGATAAALLVLSAPAQASQHDGQLTKMVSSFASQYLASDFLQTVTSSNFKFEARKTSGGGSIGRSSSVSRSTPSRSDSVSRSSSSSSKSSNTSSGSNSSWGNKKSNSGSGTPSNLWGKKKETSTPTPTPSKNNNTYSKESSGSSSGHTTIINKSSGGGWDFLMGYLLAKATTPSNSTPAPVPQTKPVDNSMSDLNVNGTDISKVSKGTILDKVPQKIKPELDGRINSLRTIEAKAGISDGSSKPKIK